MSEKSNFHVELPDNLKGKFRSLERKLWLTDTAIALSGLAAGLVCFYLLLFVSDRFWDTPAGVRLLFTGAGLGVAAWYAWFWINHWIVNRRDHRVLAAIVQQKHRRMGDRLMSAVELTDHDERPDNVSEVLCRAAIDQIANESERFSFNKAVATRKPFLLTLLAIFVLGLLSLPLTYTVDASSNAAKRANPFSSEARYTFVENVGLTVNGRKPINQTFYVERGEEIALTSKYAFADAQDGQPFWETLGDTYNSAHNTLKEWDKSLKGTLDIGLANSFAKVIGDPSRAKLTGLNKPRFATMKDGRVQYTLPGRTEPFDLTLRVGDARRSVRIEPKTRPELSDTRAFVKYPPYLYYPEPQKDGEGEPVRGTIFSYLEGSSVKFRGVMPPDNGRAFSRVTATATRLRNSEVMVQPTHIGPGVLETEYLDLDEFRDMNITWVDQYQLTNDPKAPWKLDFEPRPDELPHHVECLNIAPEIAILRSEVVGIEMIGEDEFAMRELGVEWYCWRHDGTNMVKVKEGTAILQRKEKYSDALAKHQVAMEKYKATLEPYKAALEKHQADLAVYQAAIANNPDAKLEKPAEPVEPVKPLKPDPHTCRATFLFNPGDDKRALNIPEGTVVDIYAVAKDYYSNERKKLSLPVRIQIISKEKHAQLIQEQFKNKLAELDDLVRREENLEDATRETGKLDEKEMNSKQTDKQIARQKQEQDSIADKLKELAEEIEELGKEAIKNPEMDPTDVAKMAELSQKMKDAAAKEMAAAQAALQLTIDQEQKNREENLADAAEKEKEAKEKLEELQDKAEETEQAMYANTLVKRLRKIAKFENKVAEDFTKNFGALIGRSPEDLDVKLRTIVNDAFGYQGIYSREAHRLQEEIASFYDATNNEKFGKVTSDMANWKPVEKMEHAAGKTKINHIGDVINLTTKIAEKFNEWADIIDPQDDSEPGEGEGQPGEPNEDLIARLKELLRLRQAEMDLREKTLRLDAESGIREKAQLEDDAFGLQFRQLELLGDLQKERDERGDGEFLPAAQFRMRDAEDELNLQGDEEGLEEAYKWALVAKAKKGSAKIDATLKALGAKLTDKQRKRAEAKAKAIQDSDK